MMINFGMNNRLKRFLLRILSLMKMKPSRWLAAGLALNILLALSPTAFRNPQTVTIVIFTGTLTQTPLPGATATFTRTPTSNPVRSATPGTPAPGQPNLPGGTPTQPITPLPTEAISGNTPTPRPASSEDFAIHPLTPASGDSAFMPTALSGPPLTPQPMGADLLTQTALAGRPTGTATFTATPSVPTPDRHDSAAWIEIALGGLVAGGLFAGLFLAVRKSILH